MSENPEKSFFEEEREREKRAHTFAKKERAEEKAEARGAAVEDLAAAEKSAEKVEPNKREDNLDGAKNEEESVGRGFYRGKSEDNDKKKKKKKGTVGGFFKKKGPMGLILGLLIGGGGLLVGMQSLMPEAISELIIEKLNSVGVSTTLTSDVWLNSQLNQATNEVVDKAGTVGLSNFAFTEHQIASLKKQDLIVVNDASNTHVLAILYWSYNQKKYIPVVGDKVITRSDLTGQIGTLSGVSPVGSPVTPKAAMEDRDFSVPYTKASKTWRGGNSGWFDNIMSSVTEIKLSTRRNRFARFVAGTLSDTSEMFKKMAEPPKVGKDGVTSYEEIECPDGQSPPCYREVDDPDAPADSLNNAKSLETVNKILNSKAVKAAQAVGSFLNYTCAGIEAVMAIYVIMDAYQTMSYLNLVSGFLEAADKVKAGDGSESPVHNFGTNFVTASDTVDENGKVTSSNKTAMESEGMAWLFNRENTIDQTDQSVQNTNFESVMSRSSKFFSNMEFIAKAYEACGYVRVVTGVFDVVLSIARAAAAIASKGISEIIISAFTKLALNAAVTTLISLIVPFAAKTLFNMIAKNVATEWFGEDLGNALVSGANKYLGKGNATSAGQSPGSKNKVLAYLGARDEVIAMEADYQRATRSPFDITSKYTFLGSLAYSLLPLAYSGNSVMSVLRNTSSTVTSSIAAITPAAKAIDEQSFIGSEGDCALLRNVGAVGDAFCNAYEITDMDTLYKDPLQAYKNTYYLNGYYLHSYYSYYYINGVRYKQYHYHKKETYTPRPAGNGDIMTPSCENLGITPDPDGNHAQCIEFDSEGNMIKQAWGEVGYEYYSYDLTEDNKVKTDVETSGLAKYLTFCGKRTSQYGLKDANVTGILLGESNISQFISYVPVLGDAKAVVDAMKEKNKYAWITGKACIAAEDYTGDEAVYNNDLWAVNKYYQRYAENERLLENIDPGFKSAVSLNAEEYYRENPVDDSFEGQLARFSGMTKEDVEQTLALMEYYEYLEEYDPTLRYAFVESAPEEPIYFENSTVIAKVHYILPNEIVFYDVRNRVTLV